jgi:hypothetical protein
MRKQLILVALALATASTAWSQGAGDLGAPNTPGTHSPSGGGSVGPGIATRTGPGAGSGDIDNNILNGSRLRVLTGRARRALPSRMGEALA